MCGDAKQGQEVLVSSGFWFLECDSGFLALLDVCLVLVFLNVETFI